MILINNLLDMKNFIANFLTSFIGGFIGVFLVKHFIFPSNNSTIPDWAYCLILAFFFGLYSAYKGRHTDEEEKQDNV